MRGMCLILFYLDSFIVSLITGGHYDGKDEEKGDAGGCFHGDVDAC